MSAINAVGNGNMSAAWRQASYVSNLSAAKSAAANPSQPEAPVEPVSSVRRVSPDAAVRTPVSVQEPRVPDEAELNNAADNLARMRIQYEQEAENADKQDLAQAGLNNYFMNT
ncbi:MAG: hypothetical protein E7474_02900 [Ruminococcaceae bacterium]|nr:hypothetical protein [Oscillospiraceae bacterium]